MTWKERWKQWEPMAHAAAHILLLLLAMVWAMAWVQIMAPHAPRLAGQYVASVESVGASAAEQGKGDKP